MKILSVLNCHDIILVVPLCKYLVFYELALSLKVALEELNIKSNIICEKKSDFNFENDKLYILFGGEIYNENELPKKFIIYQYEQLIAKIYTLHPNVLTHAYKIFSKALYIWDYSKVNIAILTKQEILKDIPIFYVPLGYNKILDYEDEPYIKDIKQAGFIGNINCNRRKHILQTLQPYVGIYNNNVWNNNDKRIGPLIRLKAQLLKKMDMGIVLNYYPITNSCFDLYRIISYISNKCLVISEYSMDHKMNKLFEPYIIQCEHIEMLKKVEYYLTHENERKELIEKAYHWLKTDFRYSNNILKAFTSLETQMRNIDFI